MQKLREAGKNEDAERLQREIGEMQRRLAGRGRPAARPRPTCGPGSGIFGRRWTTSAAAGLAEQAEQIGQQIERLLRELPPDVRERALAAEPPREGPPEVPAGLVGELRREIDRLRRESDEMRRMIGELREGQERLLRELAPRER